MVPGTSAPRPADSSQSPLLVVERLTAAFPAEGRLVPVVDEVSFSVDAREVLGLVGESGCGKSVTALSILRLVPPPGRITGGTVTFEGRNLMALDERGMAQVRGSRIGCVFQEPSAALHPLFTIGDQIAETVRVHSGATRRAARARAVELLADEYPHQLSGGLQQRAMIAVALACRPPLLIADEPTTALDATVQAEILDLLADLKAHHRLALLLISHDLGVVAQHADRVAVMYAGRIVEQGPVGRVVRTPAHPYTRGLLASVPGGAAGSRLEAIAGVVPTPAHLGPGCAFAPRCAERFDRCEIEAPGTQTIAPAHEVRCHLHDPDRRRDAARESGRQAPGAEER